MIDKEQWEDANQATESSIGEPLNNGMDDDTWQSQAGWARRGEWSKQKRF